MRHLLPFVALATLAAPPVFAQEKVLFSPRLIQQPTPEQIKGVTPPEAAHVAARAWVALRCGFDVEGWLVDCAIRYANHPGLGFEQAALKLIDSYRIEPTYAKAQLGAKVELTLSFGWPWASPAPPVIAPPAPPAPPRNPVVTRPDWVRKPTGGDVARVYPKAALAAGQSGRVTLSCQVIADGTLRDCNVVMESPADMGFGEAAKSLSSQFRMRPTTADGQPVGGATVRIPLMFSMPER
ncbi:energy transducer TonB [Caulobacter sp. NIBR1757]|uniref:energy transducer TonB n=1 Tax=Caulobacter sp. NIBR1757 TaxID=3016000 RepID=UPI0022F0AB51|nr:energy transducer TonB [Caulobacter sp. NIBR1757]WGM40734.1 hypothetical protein AMEJIAPC_03681 [Caulobacter sp. NIBR1757]